MDIENALADWRSLLGSERVLTAAAAQARYGQDTSGQTRQLHGALLLDSPAPLPELMRIAQRHAVAVHPISTGRNWGYGSALPVAQGCVLLDLGGMDRILHFDAEMGTVTVEPGVTQSALAAFLAQGQHPYLVPVTGAGPSCSLLANALERGYGVTPQVDHFGAVTDLEAVLPDGTLYRSMLKEAGGDELARLFRWGLGPYNHGLFTQSGMGVVTQVTIALAPRPEVVMVCLFGLPDDQLLEPAVQRIRLAIQRLQPTLGAVNLMNQHRVLSMSAPYPWDRLNAHGLIPPELLAEMGAQFQVQKWTGFATLYGTRRMVAAAKAELKQLLAGVATRVLFLTPGRAETLAKLARWLPGPRGAGLQKLTAALASSLDLVQGQPNETALPLAYWRHRQPDPRQAARHPAADGCGLIWYAPLVPMQPAAVRRYANLVHTVTAAHGIEPLITFTTVSDRLFDSTVPILFDQNDATAKEAAQQCYAALLTEGRASGFFPYRFGIGGMASLLDLAPEAAAFNRRIQAAHDPQQLLAPGRYR